MKQNETDLDCRCIDIGEYWIHFTLFFHAIWEFFIYLETPTFLVKGCIFWYMIGTSDHLAVRDLNVPHPMWQVPTLHYGHILVIVILTYVLERLAVELSLLVLTTLVCLDRGSTPVSRGERSTFSFVLVSIAYSCEHFFSLMMVNIVYSCEYSLVCK